MKGTSQRTKRSSNVQDGLHGRHVLDAAQVRPHRKAAGTSTMRLVYGGKQQCEVALRISSLGLGSTQRFGAPGPGSNKGPPAAGACGGAQQIKTYAKQISNTPTPL
ncbi:hypothetical protein N9L68_06300 [bacterium]|nr:hypothetical protein [bacterium]